jgi:hypothetical protein
LCGAWIIKMIWMIYIIQFAWHKCQKQTKIKFNIFFVFITQIFLDFSLCSADLFKKPRVYSSIVSFIMRILNIFKTKQNIYIFTFFSSVLLGELYDRCECNVIRFEKQKIKKLISFLPILVIVSHIILWLYVSNIVFFFYEKYLARKYSSSGWKVHSDLCSFPQHPLRPTNIVSTIVRGTDIFFSLLDWTN